MCLINNVMIMYSKKYIVAKYKCLSIKLLIAGLILTQNLII